MHDYFYRPEGMTCAAVIDPKYHLREIADALSQANPAEYPLENIYFFGWSGKLSFAEREKASKDLALAINKLIASYKEKQGITPKIRIITHSHGGNVVLNMAKIKDKNAFTVDELILLACPVQEQTEQYIADPLFKEIFALYSAFDLLQVIDPQGLYKHNHEQKYPLFSRRCFPDQPNLAQVKMKINKRAMLHVDFIRTKFVASLPSIIEKLHMWHAQVSNEQFAEADIRRLLSMHVRA